MILKTENLSKSFGKTQAVDGLSLKVPEGSVYGFLGPNGGGKSTTIRMMMDLITPDSGEVFIQEKSVQKNRFKALSNIGALIERPDFYQHLSGQTNLEMLARMDGVDSTRIQDVLSRVGLSKRASDKVKHYSQGMRQRLGIAQALLSQPKLLILDEPTNGLDPQGMKEVRELIGELSSEGITVFLSSHLLDEVQKVCDHVGIINQGKLIIEGKITDLLKDSNLFLTEIKCTNLNLGQKLLAKLSWVHRCDIENESIWISVNPSRINEVIQHLVQNEIKVDAVIPRTSLEEIFLSKTGTNRQVS